jgi:hypothetical protein
MTLKGAHLGWIRALSAAMTVCSAPSRGPPGDHD